MVVQVVEAYIEREERAAGFEEDKTKAKVLRKLSEGGVWEGRLRKSLSDICCARKEESARCVVSAACSSKTSIEIFRCDRHSFNKKEIEITQAQGSL